MNDANRFLDEAITLALDNIRNGGRPFGAVVVKDGTIVARAVNRMLADNDPTAHAELLALRAAGKTLGTPRLEGYAVYASGQPCPMCMAAMRIAGISDITYAYSNAQGDPFGLSTATIAAELTMPIDQRPGLSFIHRPRTVTDEQHLYRIWQRHSEPRR